MDSEIERLTSNKKVFNEFVYTPLDEAIVELVKRSKDKSIKSIDNPMAHMKAELKAIIFRHIATPNYEIRRFIGLVDGTSVLKPVVLEYLDDKFTNINEWKHSLGKLSFYKGRDSKGGFKTESKSIIDFNKSNGKSISSLKTLWGQSLVDFHHEKFKAVYPKHNKNTFDMSDWLNKNGHSAKNYYISFLKIFIKHGILFEDFLLNGQELEFTKKIILPALLKIRKETGLKPLIVSLESAEIDNNKFWLSHPFEDKIEVMKKLKSKKV